MPRCSRALGALLTGLAILVLGTASAFAAPSIPNPEPPTPKSPATYLEHFAKRPDIPVHKRAVGDHPHKDVKAVKRGANGQVDVTIYTPAPGISEETLAGTLQALGFEGVEIASDEAEATAPGTSTAAAASTACTFGAARTIRCPSVHWANSGFADPQVRFLNVAGAQWPVEAAVREWNRAAGIDSYHHAQRRCSFQPGNHCVSVQDGNYGATGWVGQTSYSYSTRTRNFIENSVSVKLNGYYSLNADGRRQTVCHELGHALGLGHNVRDLSCMWHQTRNTAHRVPDNDDFSLLASIYSVVR